MQAAFKYIEGKKTGKTHKTCEKFAKFTVSFTDLTGKNIGTYMPMTLERRNFQLDGSPMLTIGGTGHPGSFTIKGDSENLNPAAIHFTILGLGCYQAQNSTESTLFMRMKPFIEKLFTKLAWVSFDDGNHVLIHIHFEDEVVTETEETEPDQIFFACSSKATKAAGESSIKIIYDKDIKYPNCQEKAWWFNNLESLIVPDAVRKAHSPAEIETAFLNMAKNMFEQSPFPEDAKIWNFKAVTKTVTDIVLV